VAFSPGGDGIVNLRDRTCWYSGRLHDATNRDTVGLRSDDRGRDGGVREELATGAVQLKPKTEVEATSILPPRT